MTKSTVRSALMAASLAASAGVAAAPAPGRCDRACLAGIADTVLASVVAHDATSLPLAPDYAATENLVPSVPAMMTAWRTVTAVKARHYTIDPVTQQLFFAASVAEGATGALLYGRIAVKDGRVSELEIYVNRARAQGGFMFDPDGIATLPRVWTQTVAASRRPSRDELLAAGRSLFDPSVPPPPADPSCVIVETGRVAHLSGEMQAAVTRSVQTKASAGATATKLSAVSCEIVDHRPGDAAARVLIADEAQGEVVSLALIHGIVSSYLMSDPPESTFLPDKYYARYQGLQEAQRARFAPQTPMLRPKRTGAAVAEIARIFDGRIQGFQRFIHLTPEGAVSPWVVEP